MISPLSLAERSRLDQLEATIEGGLEAYLEVGRAMAEVCRDKLYRETWPDFGAYCQERWGFSRSYAYRLVQAADIVDSMSGPSSPRGNTAPPPESERQARELAPLPAAERAEVWASAVEAAGGEQPTAAQVRELTEERLAELEEEALAALPPAAREAAVAEEAAREERRAQSRTAARSTPPADGRKRRLGRADFHARQCERLLGGLGGDEPAAALALLARLCEEIGRLGGE